MADWESSSSCDLPAGASDVSSNFALLACGGGGGAISVFTGMAGDFLAVAVVGVGSGSDSMSTSIFADVVSIGRPKGFSGFGWMGLGR